MVSWRLWGTLPHPRLFLTACPVRFAHGEQDDILADILTDESGDERVSDDDASAVVSPGGGSALEAPTPVAAPATARAEVDASPFAAADDAIHADSKQAATAPESLDAPTQVPDKEERVKQVRGKRGRSRCWQPRSCSLPPLPFAFAPHLTCLQCLCLCA